jgi:hypothetical protein
MPDLYTDYYTWVKSRNVNEIKFGSFTDSSEISDLNNKLSVIQSDSNYNNVSSKITTGLADMRTNSTTDSAPITTVLDDKEQITMNNTLMGDIADEAATINQGLEIRQRHTFSTLMRMFIIAIVIIILITTILLDNEMLYDIIFWLSVLMTVIYFFFI